MRPWTRLAPLLLLAACGRTGPDATPPRTAAPGVPQSATLAGLPVETAAAGPWEVRRLARPAPRTGEDGKALAETLGGGGPRPGGLAPRGAAAAPPAPGGGAPPTSPPALAAAAAAAPGLRGPADPAAPTAAGAPPAGAPTSPGRSKGPTPGPLRAASTDDNVDFEAFLKFLAAWSDRPDTAPQHDPLDVSDRRFVRVVDAEGRPWPGARVRLADEARDRVAWTAVTYGDGRAPFYPRVADRDLKSPAAGRAPAAGWVVDVEAGGQHVSTRWDGAGDELTVRVGIARAPGPVKLDVAILLDTTGSMGDEIDRIRSTLLAVVAKVRAVKADVDLRFGAVLYRDLHDDYVTMRHPFTADLAAFSGALQTVAAGGGGDFAESLNQGLAEVVGRMGWREDAAKVVFVVADAPPHMDYAGDVPYGTSLVAAVGAGVRIHAVAASGLDAFGTLVFRQAAQLTRGQFVFIEYGSTAASAAAHGVEGAVRSNNLDDILVERLTAEVAGWGREAPPSAAPPK